MTHGSTAAQRIADYIEAILDAPGMHSTSTEGLEMVLLTAFQCYHLATGALGDDRVTNLWRHEVHQLHGNHGATVKFLSELPTGGRSMHYSSVLEPMKRIWVTMTEPVTTIAALHREL